MEAQDTYIAMQIGQYWDQVVTGGAGSHYNCNARKELYKKNCCLGVVHHTDPVARKGLETFAAYITKPDELFKLSVPGVRSFWKGHVSEPLAGPRARRPREPDKGTVNGRAQQRSIIKGMFISLHLCPEWNFLR